MKELTSNIGNAIREIRQEMKLSLDTVSQLTGVSKAMLGQIERGESTPTISTLWKISSGLKVTISKFIAVPKEDLSLVKLKELEPVEEENGKMLLFNIFPFDPISGFDYFEIMMEPGCRHESLPHPNVSKEYVVVEDGCLEMIVNDETILVQQGEAFSFLGSATHTYVNPTDKIVRFHNIMRYI